MNDNVSLLVGRYWTEIFVWIPEYVFDKDIKYIKETFDIGSIVEEFDKSRNIIFLVDRRVAEDIKDGNENLNLMDGNTDPITTIDDKGLDEYDRSAYPYNSLSVNRDIGSILVKANS